MTELAETWDRLKRKLRGDRLEVLGPHEGYDRWAPDYGENMNPVQILEAEAIARLLPDLNGRSVLDIGCGKGRLAQLALARGASGVVGVDISEVMLKGAAAALPAEYAELVQADVCDLPFEASTFDVVLCGLMLGHVEDLGRALAEIARVLKPGGTLLVSDFHPSATLRGYQRAFREGGTGRSYAILNNAHLIHDYRAHLDELGMDLEMLEEKEHDGLPIVFVFRARLK